MSTRWWVLGPDQQPYGPYDLAALEQHARDGRVAGSSMVCAEGSEQWMPAGSVPALASFLSSNPGGAAPANPWSSTTIPPHGAVRVSLVGPILVTIFCCLIGGVVSIVYASQANTKAAAGDVAGALVAAGKARTWMWVGFGIGLVSCVAQVILFAFHGFP